MTRVVIDTNVVVSAALTPDGKPAAIVQAALARRVTLLADHRVLREYEIVLNRAKLRLDPAAAMTLSADLADVCERLSPPGLALTLPDETDRPFIEVARAGRADWLVTGNQRHFPAEVMGGVRVLGPSEALAELAGR